MSVVEQYDAFVVKNAAAVSSAESTLRSLAWLLPGRFKDADLASEALTTVLNVLTMYHDTLFVSVIKNNPKYRPLIPFSLHARFTTACLEKFPVYKWASKALQLLQYTQLLIEMGLRRKASSKFRWRTIVFLEFIKAILRLSILRVTKKPILSPPLPERDFDPANLPPLSVKSSPTLSLSSTSSSLPPAPDHLKNNRSPLPPHPLFSSGSTISPEEYLVSKAVTTSSVKPSFSLVQPLSSYQDWLSEIFYILRPLFYASLLAHDQRSNRPLTIVVAIELLSRSLRRTVPLSATLERAEYGRRDRDLLWYLLRGSVWQQYTKPKLDSIATQTVNAPLLGMVGAVIQNWVPLIDEYYYYTAP